MAQHARPEIRAIHRLVLLLSFVVLSLLAAPARDVAAASRPPSRPPLLAPAPRPGAWSPLAALGVLLLAAAGCTAGYLAVDRLRRRCPRCKQPMERLADETAEALLTRVERTEEQLGSVHYALWSCIACNEEKRERRVNLFSGYGSCPSCGARALASSTSTVQQATYSHGGLQRTDESCRSCGYAASHATSTAPLERPDEAPSTPAPFPTSPADDTTGGW